MRLQLCVVYSVCVCVYVCLCLCVCQVAGRLHVELWRGTEGSEEEGPGETDSQEMYSTDGDPLERKLNCVVRTCGFTNSSDYHVI